MLKTKWKLEDAIAVRVEETREEALKEGREEGREEGVDISVLILRELIEGTAVEEIAERFNVSTEKVIRLKSALAGTS